MLEYLNSATLNQSIMNEYRYTLVIMNETPQMNLVFVLSVN